jgi:hypothetical protein
MVAIVNMSYTREELEPAELTLVCMVPVCIVMDGDLVRKVVVCDEDMDLDKAVLADHDKSKDEKLNAARLTHAIAMASDCEWPSWEFGW